MQGQASGNLPRSLQRALVGGGDSGGAGVGDGSLPHAQTDRCSHQLLLTPLAVVCSQENTPGAFAITKVGSDGAVQHIRVTRTADRAFEVFGSAYASLPDIVAGKVLRGKEQPLGLRLPCPPPEGEHAYTGYLPGPSAV